MPYYLTPTSSLWRLLSLLFIAVVMILPGCGRGMEFTVAEQTGGDPHRGKQMIRAGCQSCHTIPGVRGANGLVGPPLNQMALRVYIQTEWAKGLGPSFSA